MYIRVQFSTVCIVPFYSYPHSYAIAAGVHAVRAPGGRVDRRGRLLRRRPLQAELPRLLVRDSIRSDSIRSDPIRSEQLAFLITITYSTSTYSAHAIGSRDVHVIDTLCIDSCNSVYFIYVYQIDVRQ